MEDWGIFACCAKPEDVAFFQNRGIINKQNSVSPYGMGISQRYQAAVEEQKAAKGHWGNPEKVFGMMALRAGILREALIDFARRLLGTAGWVN